MIAENAVADRTEQQTLLLSIYKTARKIRAFDDKRKSSWAQGKRASSTIPSAVTRSSQLLSVQ